MKGESTGEGAMANETTLTARRGFLYRGTVMKAGQEFGAREQDVEFLTAGRHPFAARGTKAKAASKPEPAKPTGKLPDDFPGLSALAEAGITTYGAVRKLDEAALVDLPGIGEATAKKIVKAAK